MYDELVKRVRQVAEEVCEDYDVDPYNAEQRFFVIAEAADAIEELSAAVEGYESSTNMALVEKDGATVIEFQPKWIPVTERLPETDDIVIVAIHDDSGDTPYDVTNVGFYLDVFPLGVWVVENERCSYVTHWMPLPSAEGLNET